MMSSVNLYKYILHLIFLCPGEGEGDGEGKGGGDGEGKRVGWLIDW